MVFISEEKIMAFVDNELCTEQNAIVQQAMEKNSELRKKADLFAATNLLLQGVFDAPLYEEVPRNLLTIIYCTENRKLCNSRNEKKNKAHNL